MSSSVYYFYFSPVIDKTQPIWFLFLTVRTVVTKENLHLKKQFKTDNNECVEREWKLIFNEFVKCAMTYMQLEYDLKNFLTWKKKALNAHCFCFDGR